LIRGWPGNSQPGHTLFSTAATIAYAYVQDYERDVPEIISKGNTLEEAAKILPKAETLLQTVKRYNQFVETGKDEDFQRWPLGEGILKAPFYVMGPAESYMGVTRGGLDIDCQFQVLDQSGKVIPGLFAAGRNWWRPDPQWTWLESRLGLHLRPVCREERLPAPSKKNHS